MASDRCTAEEAIEILTPISQHQNFKLLDLAQAVVESIHPQV